MAYGSKKISPLDLQPSKAIGVKIPFSSNSVFTSVYTTKEQTKYIMYGDEDYDDDFGYGGSITVSSLLG